MRLKMSENMQNFRSIETYQKRKKQLSNSTALDTK